MSDFDASDIPLNKVKSYRKFTFPAVLGEPGHDPFFSSESPASWIISTGYQLFLTHDDAISGLSSFSPENATTKQLKAYRSHIVTEKYQDHSFFSLENADTWIKLVAFEAYMEWVSGTLQHSHTTYSSPFSSRCPSRAGSSISLSRSRASSRASFAPPSSRASSPSSPMNFDAPSRPSSSMSYYSDSIIIDASNGDDLNPFLPPQRSLELETAPESSLGQEDADQRKGKAKEGREKGKNAHSGQIKITRQLEVDNIVELSSVPSTWDVPRTPSAYRVDLSASKSLLTTESGKVLNIDTFIRSEDQESWGGSSGILKGDVMVFGLDSDPEEALLCRRCQLKCNGVDTCEFIDPTLFAGCQRFEPDENGMTELWNHELSANEREAASVHGIISRFFNRVKQSKCRIPCDGWPIMITRAKGISSHGKMLFVGCAKWSKTEKYDHRYVSIPPNSTKTSTSVNEKCVLTVHPQVGLKTCPYSHIINGQVKSAKIVNRPCPTRMIVLIPVDESHRLNVFVILNNAHNHPVHPKSKPSTHDKLKLRKAVPAVGITGLTVQKLLNAPSTTVVYDGDRIASHSPALMDTRKVCDFIVEQRNKVYPRGMGWEGMLYELQRELELPKEELVTMHTGMAPYIHKVLGLQFDFTYKRVDGQMDEWEVVGFIDSLEKRTTFASLYCDKATRPAFAQLFMEFMDTVEQVTGKQLKLVPFAGPDATCRAIILDGEVPQAQGLGDWLAIYNDPVKSGITTRDPLELIQYCIKTCGIHFERHIDEFPITISKEVIVRLKSIMGLKSQEEIDAWHTFVQGIPDKSVQNWYAHKLAHPWVLPSINKFLSRISDGNWDLTPNHSNLVESAHAGRNAETSIGVNVLTAIQEARARDNQRFMDIQQTIREGVSPRRWNGIGEREKRSAQRQTWQARKSAHLGARKPWTSRRAELDKEIRRRHFQGMQDEDSLESQSANLIGPDSEPGETQEYDAETGPVTGDGSIDLMTFNANVPDSEPVQTEKDAAFSTNVIDQDAFKFSFPAGPVTTSSLYEDLQDFDMQDFLPNFDPLQFNFNMQPSGSELAILPMPLAQSPVRPPSPRPEAPPARVAKRGRQEIDEANIIHGTRQCAPFEAVGKHQAAANVAVSHFDGPGALTNRVLSSRLSPIIGAGNSGSQKIYVYLFASPISQDVAWHLAQDEQSCGASTPDVVGHQLTAPKPHIAAYRHISINVDVDASTGGRNAVRMESETRKAATPWRAARDDLSLWLQSMLSIRGNLRRRTVNIEVK
ncbi:hypothetical protein C8J57DRAFT_1227989 [Mycena rebaudengoi]|nr:hypothetical protein C8J57DRAFT_1227989 [Mycena rebaudengoi]